MPSFITNFRFYVQVVQLYYEKVALTTPPPYLSKNIFKVVFLTFNNKIKIFINYGIVIEVSWKLYVQFKHIFFVKIFEVNLDYENFWIVLNSK